MTTLREQENMRTYSTISLPGNAETAACQRQSYSRPRMDSVTSQDDSMPSIPGKMIMKSLQAGRKLSWPVPTMLVADSPEAALVWSHDLENGLRSRSITHEDMESIDRAHDEAMKLGIICTSAIFLCIFGIWLFTGRSLTVH